MAKHVSIDLTPTEATTLRKPIRGRGGFQTLLRKLQRQLDGRQLDVSRDEMERLTWYSAAYGRGGSATNALEPRDGGLSVPVHAHVLRPCRGKTPGADPAIQSRPMAKSSIIQQYARIGAAARIKDIRDEIAAVGHMFPDLAASRPARTPRPKARTPSPAASAAVAPEEPETQAVPAGRRTRKHRKMSAAARKAISDAQKARWAKQKNTKG